MSDQTPSPDAATLRGLADHLERLAHDLLDRERRNDDPRLAQAAVIALRDALIVNLDTILAALRAPATVADGAAERMRDACARWHEEQSDRLDAGALGHPMYSDARASTSALAAEHRASARAIRALPTTDPAAGEEGR